MMSAFGWALIGRSALSRGGLLLSSPVGNQAYLSSIVRFAQGYQYSGNRNRFSLHPYYKKRDGRREGGGGGACLILWPKE